MTVSNEQLTHGSLFSGVGGMDLGFDRAGFETLWQCEIEKRLRSVLQRHWPNATRYDDVSTVNGAKVAPVDVISFGSPCQDLSVAGKRTGLAGSRSGLFHQAIRIITEMRKATNNEYPKAVVWENVTGALSSSKGNDFATVVDEVANSGAVDIQWCVLDAQNFGVPQRRRRVFLVAFYPGVGNGREVFAEPESSGGDSAEDEGSGQDAAGQVAVGSGEACWWDGSSIAPTVDASMASKGQMLPEKKRMFAVLQPVAAFVKTRRAQSVDDYESWSEGRPAPTLNSMDNGSESRATVLSITPIVAFDEYSHTINPLHHSLRAVGKRSTGCLSRDTIRRLTPRECERLMGWPDDHTRWDAEGKELADSPRYKACGNGVVSPVAQYVATQVAKALSQ